MPARQALPRRPFKAGRRDETRIRNGARLSVLPERVKQRDEASGDGELMAPSAKVGCGWPVSAVVGFELAPRLTLPVAVTLAGETFHLASIVSAAREPVKIIIDVALHEKTV